jgi:hypothetical protein
VIVYIEQRVFTTDGIHLSPSFVCTYYPCVDLLEDQPMRFGLVWYDVMKDQH